ncbi:MAG: hypothetical protein FJ206_00090 [Gemmatimonadetes bacterium]|nr:hypothetical protein [Gemmatimonadota bacterium]
MAGVPNAAAPTATLVTGGQPTAAHFEALRAAGVEVILDIRDPMEPRPFDEAALVRKLGMIYLNVPVTGATLDDLTLERILAIVREHADRQVVFHCASGNRVGGALIPHFVLDRGMTEEDAVDLAMRIGLRGTDVMEWGLDYVRRKRA